MRTVVRTMRGVAVCALVTPALAGSTNGLSPEEAITPVTGVEVRADLQRGEVIVGLRTPFGLTPVRAAEFVAERFDWSRQTTEVRAPRAIYDLDFSTSVETDLENAAPIEAAVILHQGTARLAPGPDAFVFLKTDAVTGVRVAPLLRTAEGTLAKGPEIDLDSAGALTPIRAGGQTLYAFAVDLNMWVERGAIPRNGDIMGLVLSHDATPGTGALAIAEIVAGDAPLFSQGPGAGTGGGFAGAFSLGAGGGRGSGGGGGRGGDDPPDNDEEIPAPGAGLILGLGIAAAGARRRRR